ncbi:hypothetical protein Aperf_G00000060915 [Anoplocephala perfoliata]
MASHTIIVDGLHKQFNSIRSLKAKWSETVSKSGEAFTTVAYNIMREIASLRTDRPEDLWSLNFIPQCSAACQLFLSGDPIGAAHLAAAKRIEDDFALLEDLLEYIQEIIDAVEKSVQRLAALHKLTTNPSASLLGSPLLAQPSVSEKRSRVPSSLPIECIPWSIAQAEAEALLRRLRSDLAFREGLLRSLGSSSAAVASKTGHGDLSEFQRLSFLWRQAENYIKWENLLGFEEHIEDIFG